MEYWETLHSVFLARRPRKNNFSKAMKISHPLSMDHSAIIHTCGSEMRPGVGVVASGFAEHFPQPEPQLVLVWNHVFHVARAR